MLKTFILWSILYQSFFYNKGRVSQNIAWLRSVLKPKYLIRYHVSCFKKCHILQLSYDLSLSYDNQKHIVSQNLFVGSLYFSLTDTAKPVAFAFPEHL